jgi:hypothetical protein
MQTRSGVLIEADDELRDLGAMRTDVRNGVCVAGSQKQYRRCRSAPRRCDASARACFMSCSTPRWAGCHELDSDASRAERQPAMRSSAITDWM